MQELLSEMSHPNWDRLSFDARYEMFDTLLEKEKEQIIDACNSAFEDKTTWGERYYNKTYNQNK